MHSGLGESAVRHVHIRATQVFRRRQLRELARGCSISTVKPSNFRQVVVAILWLTRRNR
jgi:hypothetical protein